MVQAEAYYPRNQIESQQDKEHVRETFAHQFPDVGPARLPDGLHDAVAGEKEECPNGPDAENSPVERVVCLICFCKAGDVYAGVTQYDEEHGKSIVRSRSVMADIFTIRGDSRPYFSKR